MANQNENLNIDVVLGLNKYKIGLTTMLQMGKKTGILLNKALSAEVDVDINAFRKDMDNMEKVYKSSLDDMEQQNDEFQKSTKKSSDGLKKFTDKAKLAGAALLATFVIATKKAIDVGKDFTATMSNLEAISGATNKELKSMSDNAERLGKSTKFTATQVGNLQVSYSKLGFAPDQINDVTGATLALAAATGEELAQSAEVAGGTLRAFNYEAEQTARVTDVMTASFSNSALNLNKWQIASSSSAKVAQMSGLEVEHLAGILGTLSDNNISASTTGVGVRNILLKINEQGSELNSILGGGVSNFDEFIKRLEVARGDSEKFAKAQKSVGTENTVVFSTLVSNIDKLKTSSDLYFNSQGTAFDKMNIQMDNLEGDSQQLNSAIEGLGITIFKELNPNLRTLVNLTTEWFLKLQETTLETTIRQLKELGASAKDLETLQMGVSIQSELQKILDTQELVDKMFKNIGASIQDVDLAKQITGLDNIREIQSTNLKVNELNRDAVIKGLEDIKKESQEIASLGYEEVESKKDTLEFLARQQIELKKLLVYIDTYEKANKSLNDTQENITDNTKKTASSLKEVEKPLRPIVEHVIDIDNELENAINPLEALNGHALNLLNRFIQIEKIGKLPELPEMQQQDTGVDFGMIGFFDGMKTLMGKSGELSDETREKVAEGMRSGIDQFGQYVGASVNIMSSIYDLQLAKIDEWHSKKTEKENKAYEEELERINSTIESEIEKKRMIETLEESHQKKMDSINEKARKKEEKAKKTMKKVKIAESISNTAVAVSQALPNLVLAGIVGAAGLVQTAAIAAQPYEKGGVITGGRQFIEANEKGTEFMFNAEATRKIGHANLYKMMNNPDDFKSGFQAPSFGVAVKNNENNGFQSSINEYMAKIDSKFSQMENSMKAFKNMSFKVDIDNEGLSVSVEDGQNSRDNRVF